MAIKLNNRDKDKLRDKIRADKLIRSLQAFALSEPIKLANGQTGVPKLTPARIRANLGLLNKVLPDLKSEELKLEGEARQKVISATPMDEEKWAEPYAGNVIPIDPNAGNSGA